MPIPSYGCFPLRSVFSNGELSVLVAEKHLQLPNLHCSDAQLFGARISPQVCFHPWNSWSSTTRKQGSAPMYPQALRSSRTSLWGPVTIRPLLFFRGLTVLKPLISAPRSDVVSIRLFPVVLISAERDVCHTHAMYKKHIVPQDNEETTEQRPQRPLRDRYHRGP